MRHLLIPDTQAKPGEDLSHIDWASAAIAEYRPDRVIHLGDNWDMASLSSHASAGSAEMENARYMKDIDAGNEAMDRLTYKWRKLPKYKPDKIFKTGNHEQRIERAIAENPRLEGVIGYHHFEMHGFRRDEFLAVTIEDGIAYAHYFQNMNSRYPVGGTIDNRLNKIGMSFVQGHQQGFLYGQRPYPTGRIYHGLVAGSYYRHDEGYKGRQGNNHWRGIVILNDVRNGNYDVMPLSIEYLERKYGSKRKRK
jgi:hypothetical protein